MSSLRPEQLTPLIRSGRLGRVYLFDGPELWFKERAFDQMLSRTLNEEQRELNFDRFDGAHADVARMVNTMQSLPFLSDKRVMLIQNAEELTVAHSRLLAEAMEHLPDSTLLVFFYQGRASLREPIPAQVQSIGQIVTFWTPFDNQLPSWLIREANERGKKMDYHAARLLCESCESVQQMSSELDKLILYIGKKTNLTSDDIEAHGLPDGMGVYKNLEEAIWKRNYPAALKQVQMMSEAGVRAEMLFPIFERIFRQMILSHAIMKKGISKIEAYNSVGARGKIKQNLLERGLSSYTEAEARKSLGTVVQSHWDLKSGALSSEMVLASLVTNLLRRRTESRLFSG